MMPVKDIAYATGIAAAVALGGANLLRTPGAPAPTPAAAGMPSPPPPPSKCKQRCAELAESCVAGRAVNCTDLLTEYEHEGKVSCEATLTQSDLDKIGWCPQ